MFPDTPVGGGCWPVENSDMLTLSPNLCMGKVCTDIIRMEIGGLDGKGRYLEISI